MSAISTVVTMTIEANFAKTFEIATSLEAPLIIKRGALLPGVLSVSDQKGSWNAIGDGRRLHMTDGSSVYEELIDFAKNRHFAYQVNQFTGGFGKLVSKARGEWHFTQVAPNRTYIDWSYTFTPKSKLAQPIVWLIVKGLWSGHMRKALERTKKIVENQTAQS